MKPQTVQIVRQGKARQRCTGLNLIHYKWQGSLLFNPLSATSHHLRASGNLLEILRKRYWQIVGKIQNQLSDCVAMTKNKN